MKICCEKKIYLRSLAGLSAPVGIWIELIPIPLSGCRSTFQSVTAPRVLAFVPGWASEWKIPRSMKEVHNKCVSGTKSGFCKAIPNNTKPGFPLPAKGTLGRAPFLNDHMNSFSNNGLFERKGCSPAVSACSPWPPLQKLQVFVLPTFEIQFNGEKAENRNKKNISLFKYEISILSFG